MNQKDRDALQAIADQVADLYHKIQDYQADEQAKFDNLSEGLQQSEQGQAIESAAELLDDAAQALNDAQGAIKTAISG